VDNIRLGLEMGFRKVDSACGGLGGCPYSKSPKGNVAT
jgi:hydroxymethylglutaryl-CoA lyase